VTSYTEIIPTMKNHEGDRHVLAAAIVGKADVIVTDNLTHFPQSVCRDFDLEVQTADQFLLHALSLYPDVVGEVFLAQVDGSQPSTTVANALSRAEKRLPSFVQGLRGDYTIISHL
jgi:hypothetical protein